MREKRGEHGRPLKESRAPWAEASGEGGVWFKLDIGRQKKADPKWLLPMICRKGGVTRADIGAIRIFDNETRFEITNEAAHNFEIAMKRPGGDNIACERLKDGAETPLPPKAPRGGEEKSYKGEKSFKDDRPFREKPRFREDKPASDKPFREKPAYADRAPRAEAPARANRDAPFKKDERPAREKAPFNERAFRESLPQPVEPEAHAYEGKSKPYESKKPDFKKSHEGKKPDFKKPEGKKFDGPKKSEGKKFDGPKKFEGKKFEGGPKSRKSWPKAERG
jgi:ATP-dependent RNA helicase DeaD